MLISHCTTATAALSPPALGAVSVSPRTHTDCLIKRVFLAVKETLFTLPKDGTTKQQQIQATNRLQVMFSVHGTWRSKAGALYSLCSGWA